MTTKAIQSIRFNDTKISYITRSNRLFISLDSLATISQKSLSEYFSLDSTQEFMREVDKTPLYDLVEPDTGNYTSFVIALRFAYYCSDTLGDFLIEQAQHMK